MSVVSLKLHVLPERYAICRLGPDVAVPVWATNAAFFSITRTSDELSLVLPEAHVPDEVQAERGWRCLRVQGPLDFSETGILAALAAPLAAASVSIFALSTFDTDYLLVPEMQFHPAQHALRAAGHVVEDLR